MPDEFNEELFIRLLLRKGQIGETMIGRLDEEFGTTRAVAFASTSELKAIDGIGPAIARKIRSAADMAGASTMAKQYSEFVEGLDSGATVVFDESTDTIRERDARDDTPREFQTRRR